MADEQKSERLQRILSNIKPKTYYEELAEYGYLAKYIDEFARIEYNSDDEFREHILEILLKYSEDVIPEIEEIYLTQLSNTLKDFIEKSDMKNILNQDKPEKQIEAN